MGSGFDRRLIFVIVSSIAVCKSIATNSYDYSSVSRSLAIDKPTYWGTTECEYFPEFILQDYQPASGSMYMQSYGLQDIKTTSDVTIVGLYYADTQSSQLQIAKQELLGKTLEKEGFAVRNVAINNFAPYSCSLETACSQSYWYFPWMPWITPDCYEYIGGCKPDDSRLQLSKWQQPLIDATTIPIFQDRQWEDAWDQFGGGQNDLLVYDRQGRLFKYICSSETYTADECQEKSLGTIMDNTGYIYIKSVAEAAARSNGTSRCASYVYDNDWDDLDWWNDDNNYYYGDDGWSAWGWGWGNNHRHWDDDSDDLWDDDGSYKSSSSFDVSGHDLVSAKIRRRRHHHKHAYVDASIFVSVIAISALIITFGILYYKYKNKPNEIKYSPVHTEDPSEINRRKSTHITRLSIPNYGASTTTPTKSDSSNRFNAKSPSDILIAI